MRYGYDLEYAGVRAESLGIYVVRRPDIPAPEYDRHPWKGRRAP